MQSFAELLYLTEATGSFKIGDKVLIIQYDITNGVIDSETAQSYTVKYKDGKYRALQELKVQKKSLTTKDTSQYIVAYDEQFLEKYNVVRKAFFSGVLNSNGFTDLYKVIIQKSFSEFKNFIESFYDLYQKFK